jgi:signal transduction histidine kinase/ligand-binding sensor domain-containing protein
MRVALLKSQTALRCLLQLECLLAIFSIVINACAGPAEPQFEVKSWDRRDELPATLISHIQRSTNGYLWLTTERGLVRFDGVHFNLFGTNSIPILQSNKLTALLTTANGDLWLGTSKGLFRCPQTSIHEIRPLADAPDCSVRALTAASDGSIWALCESNKLMHAVNGTITTAPRITLTNTHRVIVSDIQGTTIITGISNALILRNNKLVPLAEDICKQIKPDILCPNHAGGFWVTSGTNVGRLIEHNGQFQLEWNNETGASPQTSIAAMVEDRTGRLWAGTRLGAIHCLVPGVGWREITPKRSRSLGGISCIYEDAQGLIWAGTVAGNLHQIKPRLFNLWSLPTITQDSVPQTVCVAHDGTIWVGTEAQGIYRFKDDVFSHFEVAGGVTNTTVMAIFEDRDNQLWFGTLTGLYRLDNDRLQPELESQIHGQPVPALFQGRDGEMWFGTVGAVIRKRGTEIKVYALPSPGKDKEVRAIAAGRNETWIGTRSGGLFRLRKDKVEHYTKFQRPAVESLYRDSDGGLWVGSVARGLYRIKGGNMRYWSRADGFPSDWLHSILEDSNGMLWLSSNDGVFGIEKSALMEKKHGSTPLSVVHVAASEIENWSVGSGQPSATRGPDGRLWFPVGHGILSFNPKELLLNRPRLPVLIQDVKVDGVEQSFSETKPLEIYTGMKRLEFRYTIADLDSSGRLKFRYQLEGQDDKLIDGNAQRNATYGPLSAGTYHFHVSCSGTAYGTIEATTPLTLIIKPHYYETTSFRATAGLLILVMVGTGAHFVGRAKLRRKLERLEMQQAMEKERHRIAQDLHDDLGSGITEIMLLSELAKQDNNGSNAPVRSQLDDITLKARQVATAMDEIVWTVNPKNDSLPDLASYLADHAREFLRAANISCRIDMMENLPPLPVSAQQRHNLFMAVKEALNNAAKHSRATEVWLRVKWNQNQLSVVVQDNGCGFTDDAERGNGLANMMARMESIHGRAVITTQPGIGSSIEFRLPLVGEKQTASTSPI